MKILLIITLIVFSSLACADSKIDELEQYEIRSYNPKQVGIRDLVFEVRVEGLKEIIEKNLVVGKLSDLYFKIYWLNPSEYRVEVQGLPKGFKEVKEDLKQLIKGKLDFVVPEKFSEKLKPYTLKLEMLSDGKLLRAIDETYTMAVPEIDITFDKIGQLKLIETKMAMSAVRSEFFHSTKSWSANKFVLDKIITNSGVDGARLTIINELEYLNISGFGMLSKLTVKNISEMTTIATATEKAKVHKKESNTIIRFSKYEINTGKANRFITEGLLK